MIFTVPHPTDPGLDEQLGVIQCALRAASDPRLWAAIGIEPRMFSIRRSADCAKDVRNLIEAILADPDGSFGWTGHGELSVIVAELTELFFILLERPDGIVQVQREG